MSSRTMTPKHLALLMEWAKSHWYAECGCAVAPCELADTANGVALLIEQHQAVASELAALRSLLAPLMKPLVDDAGAIEVLRNDVRGRGHGDDDPGGCELCHAVRLATAAQAKLRALLGEEGGS